MSQSCDGAALEQLGSEHNHRIKGALATASRPRPCWTVAGSLRRTCVTTAQVTTTARPTVTNGMRIGATSVGKGAMSPMAPGGSIMPMVHQSGCHVGNSTHPAVGELSCGHDLVMHMPRFAGQRVGISLNDAVSLAPTSVGGGPTGTGPGTGDDDGRHQVPLEDLRTLVRAT